MITKLEIGKFYHIVGVGSWSTFVQDVRVVSVTKASQIEQLDLGVYDTWYKPYGISESRYASMLETNNYVYQCVKLPSRDPEIVASGSGDTVYIFPDMVDYTESDLLYECKSYMWEIRTKPYLVGDPLNPLLRGIDMKEVINNALHGKIFDAITTYRDEQGIIVSEAEYQSFDTARNAKRIKFESETSTETSRVADQQSYLFNAQTSLDAEKEKLRLLTIQTNNMINDAIRLYNENTSRAFALTAKDTRLRIIYDALNTINQSLPSSDQIQIPAYDDLA